MKTILASLSLVSGYLGYNYNMNSIEERRYTITNNKISKEFDGFKIIHISDLHNKEFGKNNKKLKEIIYKNNPDIIVITGDNVDSVNTKYDISYEFIKDVSDKYKTYYIIGNHEQKLINSDRNKYLEYERKIKDTNAISLFNEKISIKIKDSIINLYSIIIPLSYYPYLLNKDCKKTSLEEGFMVDNLGSISKYEYNILLSHNPFYFEDYVNWGADLVLAGHVHGGIIRIPFLGGLLSPNREFFPKYDLGEYNKEKSKMVLSKGLGGSKLIMRINCRPEIGIITLRC